MSGQVATLTAAAAAVIAGAAGCASASSSSPATSHASRARIFTAPVASAPASSARRPAKPTGSASQIARRFVEAFGAYETGQTRPAIAKALRATAAAGLVDQLLGQPVRAPRGVQRAHAGRVLLTSLDQPSGQLHATVLRTDGSSINVQLARPTGTWTVIDVRPGQLATRG